MAQEFASGKNNRFNIESEENQRAFVEENIDKLDGSRVEFLERSMFYNTLRMDQMKNEAARIAKKYGDNSQRVRKIESGIIDLKNMMRAVDMQIAIIKVNSKKFDADTWKIEGHVYANNKFVEGYHIYLSPQEGKPTEWADKTDSVGFYSITLDKETVEKLKDQKLFLFAAAGSHIVYRGTKAMMPEIGGIEREDIPITKEDGKRN